jgi:hypothetical protein
LEEEKNEIAAEIASRFRNVARSAKIVLKKFVAGLMLENFCCTLKHDVA